MNQASMEIQNNSNSEDSNAENSDDGGSEVEKDSNITSNIDETINIGTEKYNEGIESEDNENENGENGNKEQTDVEMDVHEASIAEGDFSDSSEYYDREGEELREWALSRNPTIPHTRLKALLKMLRRRLLPQLPKCAKTFLGTTTANYNNQKFNNDKESEFVYFGIANHLETSINPDLHEGDTIYLIINVDGVQLFRSSSKQFWPILCQVDCENTSYESFPVAIYSSSKKLDNLDKFLADFINEINELHQSELLVGNRLFKICIKAFVCDIPARTFLKKIKGHGAYWSCERCTVRGRMV